MALPSYIAFLILGVIAFAVSLLLSLKKYRELKNETYYLKNHFPFELNVDDYFKNNLLGNIIFIFSRIIILSFSIIYIINNHIGSPLTIGILLSISTLTSLFSFFTSLRNLKGHIVFQSISSITLFSSSFFLAYNTYGIYISNNENIISLILSILIAVISIIYLVSIIIPKNTYSIKFDEIDNDGTITYKRPKIIYTCLIEWITYILSYIIPLLLIIIETVK